MVEFVLMLMAWREGPLILRALEQAAPYCDRVALSCSRFTYMADQPEDGMAELASDWCKEHDIPFSGRYEPGYEYQVWTRAMELVGAGNYCFQFAADESIVGDMAAGVRQVKEQGYEVYGLGCEGYNLVHHEYQSFTMLRIWKVDQGDYFDDNHWTVRKANGRMKIQGATMHGPGITLGRIPHFRVFNDASLRPKSAQELRVRRYEALRAANWDERLVPEKSVL